MPLSKQIQVLAVDTGDFYSKNEYNLHWKYHNIEKEKRLVIEKSKKEDCIYSESEIKNIIKKKNKAIKNTKDELLKLLSNKVETNIISNGTHHIRTLREDANNERNVISVFESTLTRTIGARENELCEDFMIVQVYYDDIIKDLIYHGYNYKGEKYIYFMSSAGQIRTKKCAFIKESVFDKYEKTLMCGLTVDEINKRGGNNPNKFLAYLALVNSATDIWEEFDIDKAIVVDDFESDVFGEYDYVDDVTYEIERRKGNVIIPHMDGAGIMLPNAFGKEQKNKMIRMPFFKGLMTPMDFISFIKEHNASPVIKDIYGKEWDVIKDDIQVIFTKSQFKLWKLFDWQEYKDNFKRYNCECSFTNEEEDKIKNATINYQMLQTFTDFTEKELKDIAKKSIDRVNNITSTIDNLKNTLGINAYNTDATYFQKSIDLYPDLMNDVYVKEIIKETKDSMVKRYKAGALEINGKYTFVLPDLYAFCEWLFLGEKNPKGLIDDGEVFCWLFRKHQELDCLRSPHLFKEHAIRNNIAWNGDKEKQEKLRRWFTTDAIYISVHDLISRILQLDCDGDKLLVVSDKTIIDVAKRNMQGIVPLYYNARKAPAGEINNKVLYEGLNRAFNGGNIGVISNDISKVWNSDLFIDGNEQEKEIAVDVVKLLCLENNLTIDYAKNLYKSTRPSSINKLITSFTKNKLPYFFRFAKDKEEHQVSKRNKTFVNKLYDIIPNPRINMRKIGLQKINYRYLTNNPNIEVRVSYLPNGNVDIEKTDPLIVKYIELNRKYHFKINLRQMEHHRLSVLSSSDKNELFYGNIARETREELLKFGYTKQQVVDILVKFLYHIKPSKHKKLLWFTYGDVIYENLTKFFKLKTKIVQCKSCGEWSIIPLTSKSRICKECSQDVRREKVRANVQRFRNKQK